jgi:hypothetical protein
MASSGTALLYFTYLCLLEGKQLPEGCITHFTLQLEGVACVHLLRTLGTHLGWQTIIDTRLYIRMMLSK